MVRSSRSDDSDGPRDPSPSRDGDDRAGIAGVLRGLVWLAFVAAVAVGTVLYGPALADLVADDSVPAPSPDPPETGDRNPDATHPGDPGETAYRTDVETISSSSVEDFVHAEVNERRAEHGLDPIEWDGTVASVSRAHSADMHERGYFAHVNPDGEGPYDRFTEVGDYCGVYGENIAKTWVDASVQQPGANGTVEYLTAEGVAEGVVDQWMNSTSHRAAILEADVDGWDRGGVGVYVAEDGTVYATHNFCREW
ncbi:CAP domain-containing protein [Salinilacihabitans rarus]|uniref:CAP domain-containing protein n=1 Tax=Salinilacihabitans rarus TaxID=2961596 RepID=UPI0020C8CE76|nr:CAP domain-containing protein [Salinilacihabitans rarus]